MIEICCRKESVRDILYRLETLNGAVKVVRPPRNGVAVEHMSWPGFRDEIARVTRTAIGLEDDVCLSYSNFPFLCSGISRNALRKLTRPPTANRGAMDAIP